MNSDKALWKASNVFASGYPRQSSSEYTIQKLRSDRMAFNKALLSTIDSGMPGYYSVYSFPRGHSQDDNIPKVDCIFIDLDIEGDRYDPDGEADFQDWKIEMSALLARVRMIAKEIIESGQADHFRATLSGHKGLHLYLDFPTIAPNNGSFEQFKAGLKTYGETVMKWLDSTAGGVSIDRWVDVDASDLGRLARHPNTINHGAAYDDETRWCVPVTMAELAVLDVESYLELTENARWPDGYKRNPSIDAGNKAAIEIREAHVTSTSSSGDVSEYDPSNVAKYKENVDNVSRYQDTEHFSENPDIGVEDIGFLTSNYPCIKAFVNREDAFNHDNDSHIMEVNVIGKLAEIGVPRDVMHELFSEIPGYDPKVMDEQIDTVLGREYRSFNCNKIADRCGQFCLGTDCGTYNRYDDIQK